MKLVFGSDHAGFELRQQLARAATADGHEVRELGARSAQSFDYPLASDEVCASLLNKEADLGVLICGSGIGVEIRANRYNGIRAANCTSVKMAELARQHNHANVLCLGARLLEPEEARQILQAFLRSQPDMMERHQKRVELLDKETNVDC